MDIPKQLEYLVNIDKVEGEDIGSYSYEHLKMGGAYWAICALATLKSLDLSRKEEIVSFVLSCQHPNGGFGGNVKHDPHITSTHYAVLVLALYNALDRIDRDSVASYILSLKNTDGSFSGDEWGETDLRFTYNALACLKLIGRSTDTQLTLEYILKCKNFEGGFGAVPDAESHAAYTFCAVGALAVEGRLDLLDSDELGQWLMQRQTASGGFNGRPEKLPDVCYSWWILSTLFMIEREHWVNFQELKNFICKSQDLEGKGGISDRPGNEPDVFHTFFGIAGLSLMGYEGLERVDPVYALPESTLKTVLT